MKKFVFYTINLGKFSSTYSNTAYVPTLKFVTIRVLTNLSLYRNVRSVMAVLSSPRPSAPDTLSQSRPHLYANKSYICKYVLLSRRYRRVATHFSFSAPHICTIPTCGIVSLTTGNL